MNRQHLEQEYDESRERLLLAVDPLPDEALLAPGAVGDWSIRDVLAHLTVWEAELVTGLMKIEAGKKPTRLLAAIKDENSYNAARFKENVSRDLDRVFDDLFQVRRQLERWLLRFKDKDLEKPGRYKWLGKRTLLSLIRANSIDHELEHLPAIEAFAEAWHNANEDRIQLTDIEVRVDDHPN